MIKKETVQWFATRIILVIAIVLIYVFAMRPGRAHITHEWIKPVAERILDGHQTIRMEAHNKSVSFNVFIINPDPEKTDKEVTFGFPWGFYLVFPLIVLLFLDKTYAFVAYHLIIQGVLGLVLLGLFFMGISVHVFFLHLFKITVTYVVPGAAFLLILFILIKDKKLMNTEQQATS